MKNTFVSDTELSSNITSEKTTYGSSYSPITVLGFSWTLFDSFATTNKYKSHLQKLSSARFDYLSSLNDVKSKVQSTYNNFLMSSSLIDASRQALLSSEIAFNASSALSVRYWISI